MWEEKKSNYTFLKFVEEAVEVTHNGVVYRKSRQVPHVEEIPEEILTLAITLLVPFMGNPIDVNTRFVKFTSQLVSILRTYHKPLYIQRTHQYYEGIIILAYHTIMSGKY